MTTPGMAELLAAFDTFNSTSLAFFELDSGLRYLGAAGPLFITTGGIRIRGTFVDAAGVHFCDARLAAESAYLKTDAWEHFGNEIGGLLYGDKVHSPWVADRNRGLHDCVVAPVGDVADALHLGDVEPFPDGWARDWTTLPTVTDASMLALMAAGWGDTTE